MTTSTTRRRTSTFIIKAIALAGIATSAIAADLTLEIVNIESDKGNLRIAVYDNKTNFKEKSIYRAITKAAEKGRVEVVLTDVPAGEYGVMLYQDVNGNEKLDSNLLGIPKEPWSGSLQGRSVFGAPEWKDINFKLSDSGDRIIIDMK